MYAPSTLRETAATPARSPARSPASAHRARWRLSRIQTTGARAPARTRAECARTAPHFFPRLSRDPDHSNQRPLKSAQKSNPEKRVSPSKTAPDCSLRRSLRFITGSPARKENLTKSRNRNACTDLQGETTREGTPLLPDLGRSRDFDFLKRPIDRSCSMK